MSLDVVEIIGIARSRVTRSFTQDECATYHIDPRPNLETIRGGSPDPLDRRAAAVTSPIGWA